MRKNKPTKSPTARDASPTRPETEQRDHTAAGGEVHQVAAGDYPALTTNQGLVISDNQNSLRANPRGPTLLEDLVLREKIFHFDHERIHERVVHARGTGAHGFFELTESLGQYTTAHILTEIGHHTPVFTRISTVAGARVQWIPPATYADSP